LLVSNDSRTVDRARKNDSSWRVGARVSLGFIILFVNHSRNHGPPAAATFCCCSSSSTSSSNSGSGLIYGTSRLNILEWNKK
jgi:hypothetical protein